MNKTTNPQALQYCSPWHLAKVFGFASSGRFQRILKAMKKQNKATVREIKVGTRTMLHFEDVAALLTPTPSSWSV